MLPYDSRRKGKYSSVCSAQVTLGRNDISCTVLGGYHGLPMDVACCHHQHGATVQDNSD